MTGKEHMKFAADAIEKTGKTEPLTVAHCRLLDIHARALAAHCECLAMNAENMWVAIMNETPKYLQVDYLIMMKKWGLVDENGEPLI